MVEYSRIQTSDVGTTVLGESVELSFLYALNGAVLPDPVESISSGTATVGLPDGSSVVVEMPFYGPGSIPATPTTAVFKVSYTPPAVGLYSVAYTFTPETDGDQMPVGVDMFYVIDPVTLAKYGAEISHLFGTTKVYLGETSWTDDEIASALQVEMEAQAAVCRKVVPYPMDLFYALMRRVARNLSMRANHLGIGSMDGEGPALSVSVDAERRRYEAPYRRLVVG